VRVLCTWVPRIQSNRAIARELKIHSPLSLPAVYKNSVSCLSIQWVSHDNKAKCSGGIPNFIWYDLKLALCAGFRPLATYVFGINPASRPVEALIGQSIRPSVAVGPVSTVPGAYWWGLLSGLSRGLGVFCVRCLDSNLMQCA